MIRSNRVSAMRARLMLSALLSTVLIASSTGCDQSFRPAGREVPGPAGSIAAAPLSGGRIAILAGSPEAKGVFLIDETTGTVLRSFGVTKEATGIAAETPDGPILLSIGAQRDGRSIGAVEQWGLDGTKDRVVPLPSEALGITRIQGGAAYALLNGSNEARAAIPIAVPALRVGRAVPLDLGAHSLELCASDAGDFLLYTDGARGFVVIRDVHTGGVAHSESVADGATCVRANNRAYAVVGGLLDRRISIMQLPTMVEIGSIPASRDALALYENDASRLVALNATRRVSTIETFDQPWGEQGASTVAVAR